VHSPSCRASTTTPSSWAKFDQAAGAYNNLRGRAEATRLDGIGFVFATDDPFAGIDLDRCLDEQGNLLDWARPILERFPSYAEVSPSGRGLKVFIRGAVPDGKGTRKHVGSGEVEIYDRGRFFTVTGRRWPGSPCTVEDCSAALVELYEGLKAKGKPAPDPLRLRVPAEPRTDDDLLDLARRSRNGDKFAALYDRGDTSAYKGDDSAADLALCNLLAFWLDREAGRIDGAFRRSRLMRPKWDEPRGGTSYGAMTIAAATDATRETYRLQPVCSIEDETPIESRPWPAPPDEVVYHGLAGEIVRAIEPQTEADPLGLLVQ
jgi:primase-polymerase (primpol)-like protein